MPNIVRGRIVAPMDVNEVCVLGRDVPSEHVLLLHEPGWKISEPVYDNHTVISQYISGGGGVQLM